jgi:hypothetical protein
LHLPAADIDRNTVRHIHPADIHPHAHLLAVDLPDERHTHLDYPDGPDVWAIQIIPARHVVVVALLRVSGERARELPEDAWVDVYRPDRGAVA